MNISVTCSSPPLSDSTLTKIGEVGSVRLFPGQKLSEFDIVNNLADSNILICDDSSVEYIGEIVFDGLKNLELIVIFGVGYEWIDVDLATNRGILICNTKGANAQSTAEHIWGMIFGLSKRISELERTFRINSNIDINKYKGFEIYNKTLGIIGLGNIGQRVAHIGSMICKRIVGINKSKRNIDGIEIVDLKYLLRISDIIVLCVPLNKETESLIGKNELELVKQGVIIVNCAREQLVEKSAVISALKSGKIFGYGLETNILKSVGSDDSYFDFGNVILTPHNAWNTVESDLNSFNSIADIVCKYALNQPINMVNKNTLLNSQRKQ